MIRSPAGALSRWKFIPAVPVLIVAMVAAPDARGQAAPGAPGGAAPAAPAATLAAIPPAMKSANTAADLAANRPQLQAAIDGAVAILANNANAAQQTRARNWLINETKVNGQAAASATYLDAYAQILNQALLPLAKHPSARVRLNAAIVTADVAAVAKNVQLAPAAQAFLADKSDAVVLWAMKAARYIIPAQLRFAGGFNKQLADAIPVTVKNHSKGQVAGAIVLEAYAALTIDVWGAQPPPNNHITTMAPYVLNLLQQRVDLYVRGVPPAARAETTATSFLTHPRVWPLLSQQQQFDAMQAIANLIHLAGQQAQFATPGDLIELATTIQRAASGVSIVVPGAAEALKGAAGLNPQQANAGQVQAAVQPIVPALQAQPQFKALKQPPKIQDDEPAPPPASAPTTGVVLIPGASTQPTTPPPAGVPTPPGTTPATPPAPAPAPAPGAGGQGARPTAPAPGAAGTGAPGAAGTTRTPPGGAGTDAGAGTGTGTGTGTDGGTTTPPKTAR